MSFFRFFEFLPVLLFCHPLHYIQLVTPPPRRRGIQLVLPPPRGREIQFVSPPRGLQLVTPPPRPGLQLVLPPPRGLQDTIPPRTRGFRRRLLGRGRGLWNGLPRGIGSHVYGAERKPSVLDVLDVMTMHPITMAMATMAMICAVFMVVVCYSRERKKDQLIDPTGTRYHPSGVELNPTCCGRGDAMYFPQAVDAMVRSRA